MYPFGIIEVAASYSLTGPFVKWNDNPASLYPATHEYRRRNTGGGQYYLRKNEKTRDSHPAPPLTESVRQLLHAETWR